MLLCQQPLLLHSLWRSCLIPLLAVPLSPLFLLWMGLPRSYFCFSSSMFLLPTSVYPLCLNSPSSGLVLHHFQVSFNIIHQCFRNSPCHPLFLGLPILFQPMRKIVSCDISLRSSSLLLRQDINSCWVLYRYILLSFLSHWNERVGLWSELSVPEETLGCSGGTFRLCTQQSSLYFHQ